MSAWDVVRRKLERLRAELRRDDLDLAARAIRIAELSLAAVGVAPTIAIGQARIFELTTAPTPFRGLRELTVRRAGPAQTGALVALAGAPRALVAERFARGDLAYIGELDGRVLAHAWFHRGPEPFGEDVPLFPRWAIPADTFWSYHATTAPEARASGVFVKLFRIALRELFVEHRAARVLCLVRASNTRSILLHERTDFHHLGTVTALAIPGARLLAWQGDGSVRRRWLQRRGGDGVLVLPPETRA